MKTMPAFLQSTGKAYALGQGEPYYYIAWLHASAPVCCRPNDLGVTKVGLGSRLDGVRSARHNCHLDMQARRGRLTRIDATVVDVEGGEPRLMIAAGDLARWRSGFF